MLERVAREQADTLINVGNIPGKTEVSGRVSGASLCLPAPPTEQLSAPDMCLNILRVARSSLVDTIDVTQPLPERLDLFGDNCLPCVLHASSKTGNVCANDLTRYSLIPLYPKAEYHRGTPVKDWHYREAAGRSYSVYLDAENAFALTYRGIPQLVVGVERSGRDIMCIEQLQLVHPYVRDAQGNLRRPGPDGLYRFEIDGLKRNLIESWAYFNCCESLFVASSASQRSAVGPASTLTESKATKIYDAVFAGSGYTLKDFNGRSYFYRKLDIPSV
jgi:hypothetical protein